MQLGRGRAVEVGARREIGVQSGERGGDRLRRRGLVLERALELRRALRSVGYAEEHDAHVGEFLPLCRSVRGDPDHGVIPVAARELAERRGVAWFGQRELGGEEQLAGSERGGVETLEEILSRDAPLTLLSRSDESRAERERTGRQLRSGIAE